MAQLNIQHHRSGTTGNVPAANDIQQGEIAINLADLRMFTKDHNNQIQRIGGEDVAATLDFTKADGTVGGISVTGFKMNFKKANGTLTTYNIFQQMMLFSLLLDPLSMQMMPQRGLPLLFIGIRLVVMLMKQIMIR